MKKLMTGDEAIARGVYEAGVKYAAAYPGTPSTEILENLSKVDSKEMIAEWAPNEKVALESAIGACVAGARSFHLRTSRTTGIWQELPLFLCLNQQIVRSVRSWLKRPIS